MLIANGILRTVHKHSSVTTLPAGRGGGGAEEEFEIKKILLPAGKILLPAGRGGGGRGRV